MALCKMPRRNDDSVRVGLNSIVRASSSSKLANLAGQDDRRQPAERHPDHGLRLGCQQLYGHGDVEGVTLGRRQSFSLGAGNVGVTVARQIDGHQRPSER